MGCISSKPPTEMIEIKNAEPLFEVRRKDLTKKPITNEVPICSIITEKSADTKTNPIPEPLFIEKNNLRGDEIEKLSVKREVIHVITPDQSPENSPKRSIRNNKENYQRPRAHIKLQPLESYPQPKDNFVFPILQENLDMLLKDIGSPSKGFNFEFLESIHSPEPSNQPNIEHILRDINSPLF